MPTPPPYKIALKNGEEVKVNDHVYCSPSWGIRDGTPYSIARIMEFLPALGTPTFDKDGNRNEPVTRVRLAWYYRPSDVSDRTVADSRLLLAAIYSEVCELSQLRAKCFVHHRDRISDLAGWKKRPDRFYFTRLFDPWLRKEFEVIPATTVRNVPTHIQEALVSRYEYIVAEREVVPDLTDDLRLCDTCAKWCPSAESLQCDRCKKFFHMECVTPPMLSKPSRGYGWTCAPCSRAHEEEVEGHDVRHHTPAAPKPKTNAPPARGRGRPRKDRVLAEKEENVEIKHFKMWPFRYFGLYTFAEDTLDPDDLIFPRAATRVGPKYQSNVPPGPSTADRPADVEERGGDSTIEVLSLVHQMSPQEVEAFEKQKTMLTRNDKLRCSVDWLTEVTFRLTEAWINKREFSSVSMRSPIRLQKFKKNDTRYADKDWGADEIAAFEDAIQMHGAELRTVREEVGTRQMPEVVRFYGHWKNSKLGEENVRIRAARASGRDEKPASSVREPTPDDDEGSVVVTELKKGRDHCGACRTRESEAWWKAPKGLPTPVLCDSCGLGWRKYADLNVRPLREDQILPANGNGNGNGNKAANGNGNGNGVAGAASASGVGGAGAGKTADKREGTPLSAPAAKRAKTVSSQATPPPPPVAVQLRCVACQRSGPVGKVLRCKQCQFRVHASTCGVLPDPASAESWVCDLCQNEKSLEASLIPDCLLCPRMRRDPKKKLVYPPPDTYLRACKPTEGQAWVHVLCSVFVPELTYSDASRLRLVEGISAIPHYRWQNNCTLCDREDGAVIQCSECPAEYHVSCAWKQGHKFGFEMQQIKNTRRETAPAVDFKGTTGVMVPSVICKGHVGHKRLVHELCDTNDAGESALQVYCRTYKQAHQAQTHGLLRKARRLDRILDAALGGGDASSTVSSSVDEGTPSASASPGHPHCYRCQTEFSPYFHEVTNTTQGGSQAWLCHRCHAETRKYPTIIGIAAA